MSRRKKEHKRVYNPLQTDNHCDVTIVRDGKNFKGQVVGGFLGIVGKGQLKKWFAKTLKAIEARNYEVGAVAKA